MAETLASLVLYAIFGFFIFVILREFYTWFLKINKVLEITKRAADTAEANAQRLDALSKELSFIRAATDRTAAQENERDERPIHRAA